MWIRSRPGAAAWLIWLATTGVAVLAAWLGLRPVLAAAVPEDGLPVALGAREPGPTPSWSTSDSATSLTQPHVPAEGWHYLADGVWERSVHANGGTLTVRAFDGTVVLIAAVPGDGYAMVVDDRDPAHLIVVFRAGDGTESIVDVRWLADGPYSAVTEG